MNNATIRKILQTELTLDWQVITKEPDSYTLQADIPTVVDEDGDVIWSFVLQADSTWPEPYPPKLMVCSTHFDDGSWGASVTIFHPDSEDANDHWKMAKHTAEWLLATGKWKALRPVSLLEKLSYLMRGE